MHPQYVTNISAVKKLLRDHTLSNIYSVQDTICCTIFSIADIRKMVTKATLQYLSVLEDGSATLLLQDGTFIYITLS